MEKQSALEAIVSPSATRGAAEYRGPSKTGYFHIFYSATGYSGLMNTAPPIIIDIYNAFDAAWNLYVNPSNPNGFKFTQPVTSGKSTMDVYIHIQNPSKPIFVTGDALSVINIYIDGLSDLLGSFTTSQLNQAKATITHEYFHTVEFAYRNSGALPTWFKESFASWSSYRQYGTVGSDDAARFNDFLRGLGTSLPQQDPYGAALFPLYIHQYRGGDATIKSIMTGLATYPSLNVYQIVNAVTPGGFPDTFSYFWVGNYSPKWTYAPYATSGMLNYPLQPDLYPSPTPYSANPLACRVVNFSPLAQGEAVNITLNVTSGPASNLRSFAVLKQSNGSILSADITPYIGTIVSVVMPSNNFGTIGIVSMNIDASVAAGNNGTNLSGSSIDYTLNLDVQPKTLSIPAGSRYTEEIVTLGAGKYQDYLVTFGTTGTQTLQTFGTWGGTYIEILNAGGTSSLGYYTGSGYSNNAFVSYSFAANTQYRVRIGFSNSSTSATTKLAIVPSSYYASYSSISSYNDYSGNVNHSLSTNSVALARYTYTNTTNTSQTSVTFTTSSSYDAYLYIIDPYSTSPVMQATSNNADYPSLYDDDSGGSMQAKITKNMTKGKEYLVIACFYNPNTTSGSLTVQSQPAIGDPAWVVYGTSLLYPDNGGYEWRVPYYMTWGNDAYNGYAYFEYQWEADNFKYESFSGTQYLDYYMGDSLYYQVYWEVEHLIGGVWYGGYK
jgi:hypothetical protein